MTTYAAGPGRQRRSARVAALLACSFVLHILAFAFAYSPASAGILIDQVICADPNAGPSKGSIADLGISPTHKHGGVCLLCTIGNLAVLPSAAGTIMAFVWRRAPSDPIRAERPYTSPSPERGLRARAPPTI